LVVLNYIRKQQVCVGLVLEEVENRVGYRGKLEIIRDVLVVVSGAGDFGSKKTHIMYGANLSYKLLTRYLGEVLNAGLVCPGGDCYVITEKGREFLQIFNDYEKEAREVQKHSLRLNNGRHELEKLLV